MLDIDIDPQDVISQAQVLKLAQTNPIVNACVATYKHGKMSWNAALCLMVVALVKDDEHKTSVISELIPYAPAKPIMSTGREAYGEMAEERE